MELILGLPTDHVERPEEFCTAPAVAEMASGAESLGFAGVFVTDHPAPPRSFVERGGHHALEPTVVLAVAAAATTRLALVTNLYIAAYRNPLLAAKAVATLDNLSEGRLVLGVGAGYLEGEFDAAGVDFDSRGSVLDEHLAVMQSAWSGRPVTAAGTGYDAVDITSLPTPVTRADGSSLPVWVGGNSMNALRRIVRFGEGWIPLATPGGMDAFVRTAAITTIDELAGRLATLRGLWTEAGRAGSPTVAIEPWDAGRYGTSSWDAAKYRDRIAELEGIGVSHLPVMLSAIGRSFDQDRAGFLRLAEGFLEDVS